MSKPDMGSIFHIQNHWNILVIGNYYVNYQNYQNSMLLSSSDTRLKLMHLFLFTNTARRELFQYVRREYATANKFPCIITLEPGIRKRWNPFIIVYKMSVLQFMGCIKTKLALRFFSSFWYRSLIPFTAVSTRLPTETTVPNL